MGDGDGEKDGDGDEDQDEDQDKDEEADKRRKGEAAKQTFREALVVQYGGGGQRPEEGRLGCLVSGLARGKADEKAIKAAPALEFDRLSSVRTKRFFLRFLQSLFLPLSFSFPSFFSSFLFRPHPRRAVFRRRESSPPSPQ